VFRRFNILFFGRQLFNILAKAIAAKARNEFADSCGVGGDGYEL